VVWKFCRGKKNWNLHLTRTLTFWTLERMPYCHMQ
jgi:hypothetical protein